MANPERSSAFVAVNCECGRSLRVKVEQVGTEIRCWDCRRTILVPMPQQAQRVAREFSDGALVVIQGPGMYSVLIASAVVTAILCLPVIGSWCSVVAFALGASAYAEIIRRVSRGPTDVPDPVWRASLLPRSIAQVVLCSLFAAGTVVPLWILGAGEHRSPHWQGLGLAIATATWSALPLLMLALYGWKDAATRLGLRGMLRVVARHPVAITLAIAMIPTTLALLEIGLGLVFYLPGNLTFFALDYMPMPETPAKPIMIAGIPYYNAISYQDVPEAGYTATYFRNLAAGYSFEAAIPASLANPTRAGLDPTLIGLSRVSYLICRVGVTMVVVTSLVAAFGVQARWLGSMPALRRVRRAPTAAPTPAPIDPLPHT